MPSPEKESEGNTDLPKLGGAESKTPPKSPTKKSCEGEHKSPSKSAGTESTAEKNILAEVKPSNVQEGGMDSASSVKRAGSVVATEGPGKGGLGKDISTEKRIGVVEGSAPGEKTSECQTTAKVNPLPIESAYRKSSDEAKGSQAKATSTDSKEKSVEAGKDQLKVQDLPTISITPTEEKDGLAKFSELTDVSGKSDLEKEAATGTAKPSSPSRKHQTLKEIQLPSGSKPPEGPVQGKENIATPSPTKKKIEYFEELEGTAKAGSPVSSKRSSPRRLSPKKSDSPDGPQRKSSPEKSASDASKTIKASSAESSGESDPTTAFEEDITRKRSFELEGQQLQRQDLRRRMEESLKAKEESSLYRGRIKKRLEISAENYTPKRIDPKIVATDRRFRILFDVSRFDKDSISINIVGDKIDVYAKEEFVNEFGKELHEMHQIFQIPSYVEDSGFTACITKNDMLFLDAPLKKHTEGACRRGSK